MRAPAAAALLLALVSIALLVPAAHAGGGLDHFAIASDAGDDPIADQTAGQSFSITVIAEDNSNQPVTNVPGDVTLNSSSGCTGCGVITAGQFSNDGTVTVSVSLTVAGTASFSAVEGTGINVKVGTSPSFNVSPAAAAKLAFTDTSTGALVTADQRALHASVEDTYGNLVTDDPHDVDFSQTSGAGTVTGLATGVASVSGVASDTVTGANLGSVTVQASSSGLDSDTITFSVTPVDHFAITTTNGGAIGPQTAGTKFTVKITAENAEDQPVTSFSGSVDLSSNATCASGCLISVTAFSGGSATRQIQLTKARTGATITATLHGDTERGASNTFTIGSAQASQLIALTTVPSQLTSGDHVVLKYEALDPYGNKATDLHYQLTYHALPANDITFSAKSPVDFSGGLAQVTETGAVAGKATFSVGLWKIVNGTYTELVAKAIPITVVPGAATKLAFVNPPTTFKSNSAQTFTLHVEDQAGNLVTTGTRQFRCRTLRHVKITASASTKAGVATISLTAAVDGMFTLEALSPGLTSATAQFTVAH